MIFIEILSHFYRQAWFSIGFDILVGFSLENWFYISVNLDFDLTWKMETSIIQYKKKCMI